MANSKKPPVGASKPVPAALKPAPAAPVPSTPEMSTAKPIENKPAVAKAAEPKPIETTSAEMKPVEAKPPVPAPAAKPMDTKPTDVKPIDAKLAEPKMAEPKIAEAKAVETKPVAPTPVASKPVAPKPAESKPAPVAAKPAPSVDITKPAPAPVVSKPAAPEAKPVAPAPKAAASKPAPAVNRPAALPPKIEMPAMSGAAIGASLDVLKPVTVLQENVRASTEKAITVFRGQYAEVKTMAETATTQLEDSMRAAQEGSRALSFKLFEIAKAQTHAHLDHAKTLAATKTFPELVTAQQSFLVAQIEMAQTRSKDVAALAGKVANDVTAPLRASLNLLLRR